MGTNRLKNELRFVATLLVNLFSCLWLLLPLFNPSVVSHPDFLLSRSTMNQTLQRVLLLLCASFCVEEFACSHLKCFFCSVCFLSNSIFVKKYSASSSPFGMELFVRRVSECHGSVAASSLFSLFFYFSSFF
jgi:hypothetical protein